MAIFAFLAIYCRYRRWPRCIETALMPVVFSSSAVVATLVKLSYVAAAIPVLLVAAGFQILDICKYRDKKSWLGLAALIVLPLILLCLCWFFSVNHSFADLLGYYTGPNLDIVKGYADAMGYEISWRGLSAICLYLLVLALAGVLLWRLYFRRLRLPSESRSGLAGLDLHAGLIVLALLILSWAVFKAAFVRDDGPHVVLGGLYSLAVVLYVTGFSGYDLNGLRACATHLWMTVVLLAALLSSFKLILDSSYFSPRHLPFNLIRGAADVWRLLSPAGRQQVAQRRQSTLAKLRHSVEDFRIPPGHSADIYPWNITDLLANKLMYRPRPIMQSYSAYTARLQRINQEHIAKPGLRPDFLIISAQDIDARLPIGLDSSSLMALSPGYIYRHRGSKGSLVFERDARLDGRRRPGIPAAKCPLVAAGKLSWSLAQWPLLWQTQLITLPAGRGAGRPLLFTAEMQNSPLRNLLTTIFKPNPVFIDDLNANGESLSSYRFLPMASHQMLVSPLIRTNDELLLLLRARGQASPSPSMARSTMPNHSPSAFRFTTTSIGPPFSSSSFELTEPCAY